VCRFELLYEPGVFCCLEITQKHFAFYLHPRESKPTWVGLGEGRGPGGLSPGVCLREAHAPATAPGMEKFENDKAMRRLRLAEMEKRIEAAVSLSMAWCVEELYIYGAPWNGPRAKQHRNAGAVLAKIMRVCPSEKSKLPSTAPGVRGLGVEGVVVLEVRTGVAPPARVVQAAGDKMRSLQAKMAAWPHTRRVLERNMPRASLGDVSS